MAGLSLLAVRNRPSYSVCIVEHVICFSIGNREESGMEHPEQRLSMSDKENMIATQVTQAEPPHQRHDKAQTSDHAARDQADHSDQSMMHNMDQGNHGSLMDHTGHEAMFRQRFWVSLVLTIPALLF